MEQVMAKAQGLLPPKDTMNAALSLSQVCLLAYPHLVGCALVLQPRGVQLWLTCGVPPQGQEDTGRPRHSLPYHTQRWGWHGLFMAI